VIEVTLRAGCGFIPHPEKKLPDRGGPDLPWAASDLILLSLIPFSIKLHITVINKKKNYSILNNNQLGPYLAGLISGAGSIYTTLDTNDPKAKKNVPHPRLS